jgi:hypothetical protein
MKNHRRAMRLDDADNRSGIAEIGVHQLDPIAHGAEIGIVPIARRSLDTQHLDITPNEILSEVRPVLATDTRNQCAFDSHGAILLSAVEESRHAADPQGILLA